MGANSIFNPSTIPTPPKGKGSREDVVTPLSEVSVEKTRKTEREVLTNAAKLLTEVRSTNLVDEHKVKELRTLTVKAGKEGFKNDAERVALSHLTYQVRHLLERYEAEMAKNGPFAQAMKDATRRRPRRTPTTVTTTTTTTTPRRPRTTGSGRSRRVTSFPSARKSCSTTVATSRA